MAAFYSSTFSILKAVRSSYKYQVEVSLLPPAQLARLRPWCIRGNASEIIVLAKHVAPEAEGASSGAAGAAAGGPKGVDTAHSSDAAVGAAQRLAAEVGYIDA